MLSKLVNIKTLGSIALVLSVNACSGNFNFVETSIEEVQKAIKSGQITCEEVVSGYLERIRVYNQSTGLNAITVLNERAIEEAAKIDQSIRSGAEMGSLFCVPVVVKDNFDTFDMPTAAGSIALKDTYALDDAFMVRKLREADAIILAKTNMAEWAFDSRHSNSSTVGVTANAYDQSRSPAGSSGGTAVAVAANFAVAGLGTDTGNSIRGPSSHAALFGIRSTLGLTSRDGVVPLAYDRDIAGPMTRTVRDGAILFNVIAGYDEADPMTELGRGKKKADYTDFLKKDALKGMRIGVVRALTSSKGSDPETISVFEKALSDLQSEGAILIDQFEIANLDEHRSRGYYCKRFRYDAHQYLKTRGEDFPVKDVAADVHNKGLNLESSNRWFKLYNAHALNVHPRDEDPSCPDYEHHTGRQAFKADVEQSMDRFDVDVIVYPSWTYPPTALETALEDYVYQGDNSQQVAPATGLPAATVPMGFTEDGMPAGLQILARSFREDLLFATAYAYEQATLHRLPPKKFPELKHVNSAVKDQ